MQRNPVTAKTFENVLESYVSYRKDAYADTRHDANKTISISFGLPVKFAQEIV